MMLWFIPVIVAVTAGLALMGSAFKMILSNEQGKDPRLWERIAALSAMVLVLSLLLLWGVKI